MRDLLLGVAFALLCFSFVSYKVAEAMPADNVPREAVLVSLTPDGIGVLKVPTGQTLETKISGYKVGDTVPVWVNLIGGDLCGLRDGPLEPSRFWLFPAVLGLVIGVIGLTRPKGAQHPNPGPEHL